MRRSILGATAVVTVLLIASMSVTACGPGADAVATVNGTVINRAEIDQQLAQLKKASPQTFAGTEGQKREEEFRLKILQSLIQVLLLRQGAEQMGITVTDKQVNDYVKAIEQQYGGAQGLANALKQAGTTLEQLKQSSKDRLLMEAITKKLQTKTTYTEKELRDYYDQNKALFTDQMQVHAAHILFASNDKKLAEDVLAQVKAGKSIATLAKKYSIDPGSKNSGGDLGWSTPDKYVPEFATALESMKVGDVRLVKTQYGWHVIKLLGKKGAKASTYAQVKDRIAEVLRGRDGAEVFTRYLDDLRKKAKIEILDATFKKLIESSVSSPGGASGTSKP